MFKAWPRAGVLSGPGLCLFLAACLSDRSEPAPNHSVSIRVGDSVQVTLELPARARVGDIVAIELRVTNITNRPVELHLQGRDVVYDLMVSTNDGLLWRRLQGRTVQSILQLKSLAPAEVMLLRDVWKPEQPGDYTVRGEIPTDAEPLRTKSATLQVR
jgi:hypothetical protein